MSFYHGKNCNGLVFKFLPKRSKSMDDPFGGSTDLYHDDSAAERRHLGFAHFKIYYSMKPV
jgi:hypothetical protein